MLCLHIPHGKTGKLYFKDIKYLLLLQNSDIFFSRCINIYCINIALYKCTSNISYIYLICLIVNYMDLVRGEERGKSV